MKLWDQNLKCSICGVRRFELVMFWNTVQSLAFSDGEPYRTVWSLRLYGKDTTEEPWGRYPDEPNPSRAHDPEVPELAGRPRPFYGWNSGVRFHDPDRLNRATQIRALIEVMPPKGRFTCRSVTVKSEHKAEVLFEVEEDAVRLGDALGAQAGAGVLGDASHRWIEYTPRKFQVIPNTLKR